MSNKSRESACNLQPFSDTTANMQFTLMACTRWGSGVLANTGCLDRQSLSFAFWASDGMDEERNRILNALAKEFDLAPAVFYTATKATARLNQSPSKCQAARHLAELLERPLLSYRASDFLDPYLGVTEQKMAAAFRQAGQPRQRTFGANLKPPGIVRLYNQPGYRVLILPKIPIVLTD